MPELKRPDGVEIHWEQQGDGPLVVLSPFWSHHPSAFENLISDLAVDHRVVRYDARGTGQWTRSGPHDIETGATDLAADEAAEPPAVVITQADALNRALRVGARRPELASAVLGVGNVSPVAVKDLEGQTDALIASASVREAGLQFAETDYRAALRAVVPPGNRQMGEDEVRARVEAVAAYCPKETAIARLEAWWDDDPLEPARAMGDRLWLILVRGFAGELFPAVSDARLVAELVTTRAHEPCPSQMTGIFNTAAALRLRPLGRLSRWINAKPKTNPSRVHLRAWLEDAARTVPPDSLVLDAGAGKAPYRELFDHARYESADFLAVGKEHEYRPTYVCDLTEIPVADARFDAAICSQVLEHVPDPPAVLAELHRVLKPGAPLWLSAPLFYEEHQRPYDFFRYTQYGFRHLAEEAGFEVGALEWLEGYDATLSYQLAMAARELPPRLAPLRLGFAVLARWFARRDMRHPDRERGMCKNYAVKLVKASA